MVFFKNIDFQKIVKNKVILESKYFNLKNAILNATEKTNITLFLILNKNNLYFYQFKKKFVLGDFYNNWYAISYKFNYNINTKTQCLHLFNNV